MSLLQFANLHLNLKTMTLDVTIREFQVVATVPLTGIGSVFPSQQCSLAYSESFILAWIHEAQSTVTLHLLCTSLQWQQESGDSGLETVTESPASDTGRRKPRNCRACLYSALYLNLPVSLWSLRAVFKLCFKFQECSAVAHSCSLACSLIAATVLSSTNQTSAESMVWHCLFLLPWSVFVL
jgi:hypothetical protein